MSGRRAACLQSAATYSKVSSSCNEWQASGVPVVGCNRGGIPSLIDDGKTGFLFEPGDSEPFISVE